MMAPLTKRWRTRKRLNGRPTAEIIGAIVKPNDRLTSVERFELYNRQYWFRLMDIMRRDFPRVFSLLGKRADDVITAYLIAHPSTSSLLDDLGTHLAEFLAKEYPKEADLARFERAQVVADGAAQHTPRTAQELSKEDATTLRLRLQPHITLLEMAFPWDTEASPTEPQQVFVAVYRHGRDIFFKRLSVKGLYALTALQKGATLAEAFDVGEGWDVVEFAEGVNLGWFW